MRSLPVHFWLPFEPDESFRGWDPDAEPEKYADGLGHGVLELYKRLQDSGAAVTIGPVPPRRCNVVFHLETVWRWSSMTPAMNSLSRLLVVLVGRGGGTAIRGDVPLGFSVAIPGVVEVMPNRSSITRASQMWLPLLPQRGMVRRSKDRLGSVRSVSLIGFRKNIPDYFLSAEFGVALESIGVTVTIRTAYGPFENPGWHDFRETDCVIAVRDDPLGTGLLRKPPTALINAWVAGAIPIVGAEPAYLELARPNVDCLVVGTVGDVYSALRRLHEEPGLIARLEAGGRERANEFAAERVLDQWRSLLLNRTTFERSATVALGASRLWMDLGIRRTGRVGKRMAGRLFKALRSL